MTEQTFPHMSDKNRIKDRPIQDSIVNESGTWSKEAGEDFISLLKARRGYRKIMNLFEKDKGTGKNTHKRGLAAQKHRLEVEEFRTPLKVVAGTEFNSN